jgi:DNA processing protein
VGRAPKPAELLPPMKAWRRSPCPISASERERIVSALGPSLVDIDELIRATQLSARDVHIVLLELDLAGRLQRHGQQLVSLIDGGG